MNLHAFDVLDVLVRVFVSSTTLLWIDDLGWTSLASRGRIRIFTFRCPEVGLEFSLDALLAEKSSLGRQGKQLRSSHYRGGGSRGRVRTDRRRGIPKKRARSRHL